MDCCREFKDVPSFIRKQDAKPVAPVKQIPFDVGQPLRRVERLGFLLLGAIWLAAVVTLVDYAVSK